MTHISALSFQETTLPSGRAFYDYLADGESIRTRLPEVDQGFATPFGWLGEYQADFLRWLKLQVPGPFADAPFEPGRVPILVCPFDADIDCSGTLVRVTEKDGVISWSTFGHGVTYEPSAPPDEHPEIGTIYFDADQYRVALDEIAEAPELEQNVEVPQPLPAILKPLIKKLFRR